MRYAFILFFLAIKFVCQGQFKAINMDASLDDSPIIFRDFKNHILFRGLKDFSRYGVSVEGASLTSPQYNNVVSVTDIKRDTVTIHLFKSISGKPKIIYSRKFIAQNIDKPKVVLKEDSAVQPSGSRPFYFDRLEVEYLNPNYTGECKVAHFEISIEDSKGELIVPPTFISGNYINPPVSNKIALLTAGSKVHFSQVIIKYSGEEYIKYEDFVLEKE
jgi:hypothetical protein